MSRTPIREALTPLAAEGLVELRTNRSAIVAPITAQSVSSYFEPLGYLPAAVTRLAALRRTETQLAAIRACQDDFAALLREERGFDRGERNRDFHLAIAAAANNRFLAEQYRTLLDRGVRLANIPFYSEEDEGEDLDAHFRHAAGDHEAMIEAIADGNGDRAEAVTLDHVELFRSRIFKFLSQYGTSLIGERADGGHRNLPQLRHAPPSPPLANGGPRIRRLGRAA